MSDRTENNPINDVMEILIEYGFDGMEQAMSILINEAIKIERAGSRGVALRAFKQTPRPIS